MIPAMIAYSTAVTARRSHHNLDRNKNIGYSRKISTFVSKITRRQCLNQKYTGTERAFTENRVRKRRLPIERKRLKSISSDKFGAGGRNRTDTLSPEPDFESGASTSSTTPAALPF